MYNARFSSDKGRHTGEDCTLEGKKGNCQETRKILKKKFFFFGYPVVASFIDIQK